MTNRFTQFQYDPRPIYSVNCLIRNSFLYNYVVSWSRPLAWKTPPLFLCQWFSTLASKAPPDNSLTPGLQSGGVFLPGNPSFHAFFIISDNYLAGMEYAHRTSLNGVWRAVRPSDCSITAIQSQWCKCILLYLCFELAFFHFSNSSLTRGGQSSENSNVKSASTSLTKWSAWIS